MTALLLEPFSYGYMTNAMWVSALVGGVCAFLSCFLMLKGWSLIGDALSHSVVPGVAGAYMLGLPFALGAFLSGGLAAAAMLLDDVWITCEHSSPKRSVSMVSRAFLRSLLPVMTTAVRQSEANTALIIMVNREF